MRAHTRTRRIKGESTPQESERPLSAQEVIQSLSWNVPEWAMALRGYRYREGLTQKKLGKILGIEQSNISKMERGERSIGKNLAKKLAYFFKTDYKVFL